MPPALIYDNPTCNPSAGINPWTLRLQQYQIKVKYQKGEIQDTAYRVMRTSEPPRQVGNRRKQNITWSTSLPNQPKRISDPTLPAVGNWHIAIKHLCFDTPDFRLLGKVKDVLTPHIRQCYSPQNRYRLQKHVVVHEHEVHQGLVKTNSLLRENVWFPSINRGR